MSKGTKKNMNESRESYWSLKAGIVLPCLAKKKKRNMRISLSRIHVINYIDIRIRCHYT